MLSDIVEILKFDYHIISTRISFHLSGFYSG